MQLSTFTKITVIPRENKYRDFPVAVRLKAAEMTVRVKPPVDIVAAIDISGSMRERAGGPSKKRKMDLIEQAMGKVIKNLSGAMNRITVVTFDDKIRLVTALEEMTEKGQGIISVAILKDRKDHNDRLAFIIFFSDGEDDKFQVENIKDNLGCVIRKLHACNEDLDKITEKLDQLTAERTTSMVAVDTIVHLKPLHPGVFLSKIESKIEGSSDSSDSKISEDKQSADIFVGVISSDEQREFTVFLDVPEGHGNGANGTMDLLAVGGSYKQSWDRKTVALGESIVTVKRPGATNSCKELHWIKERMEYWCKVKLNLSAMYEKETAEAEAEAEAGVKCKCHIQQVLREASQEVINKEMHHDIYSVST
ncbi:hypothetical protein HU200_013417 [Digitaria exilis]|uniref:VWFA domain-containing protein n=1 Tax=Digitaria exilis TaxID=1010633 RepID=A0A835KJN3_9POAL|nr:hypothetical protein HU200_013417 [Digitaria exilis]